MKKYSRNRRHVIAIPVRYMFACAYTRRSRDTLNLTVDITESEGVTDGDRIHPDAVTRSPSEPELVTAGERSSHTCLCSGMLSSLTYTRPSRDTREIGYTPHYKPITTNCAYILLHLNQTWQRPWSIVPLPARGTKDAKNCRNVTLDPAHDVVRSDFKRRPRPSARGRPRTSLRPPPRALGRYATRPVVFLDYAA